jgi:glucokinase
LEPGDKRHSALRPSLIADIGATNARFAVVCPDGGLQRPRVLSCEDFPTIHGAIASYLEDELPSTGIRKVEVAALAIAGPVTGDKVALTNHPWSFSIDELRDHLGIERLHVLNDFAAVANAMPHLDADERMQIGGSEPVSDAPVGVLGPGSGLGVCGLVRTANGWLTLPGEGGHATMAPANSRESAVLDRMRARHDHVSAERVLSGPGLVDLYTTLAEVDGVPAVSYTAPQITSPGACEADRYCAEAVDMFCAMLGTIAGNLALTLGARGGIYVAGGIVPKLGARFPASAFRERFESKGRLRPYLAKIPTYVVTHPFPAFLGLSTLLTRPRDEM